MRQLSTIGEVRAEVRAWREQRERVAFVPTMGALHEGHLRLVDEARARADQVVMSIFVNPTQFGQGEDFTRYPRDPDGDAAKAASRGVTLLFAPSVETMYPIAPVTSVLAPDLARRWEGESRPGHFAGVLTVVAKLFNIVTADVAVFGRKDLQQATLISRMVDDLNMPVEIVVSQTVREPDGLALSSRNAYLDSTARRDALALIKALRAVTDAYAAGQRDGAALTALGGRALAAYPAVRPEYLAIVDRETLDPVVTADGSCVAIVAARVGPTRLIDNMVLGAPE